MFANINGNVWILWGYDRWRVFLSFIYIRIKIVYPIIIEYSEFSNTLKQGVDRFTGW